MDLREPNSAMTTFLGYKVLHCVHLTVSEGHKKGERYDTEYGLDWDVSCFVRLFLILTKIDL